MTKLLQVAVPVVLAMLSLMPRVDAPTHAGIHEGIFLRECNGGTAWNQVETGDCPLTSPTQGIQPVVWCTCASRRAVSYSKKPRRLQQKRLKICSRLNIILLLLLLLSGDIETNPGPNTSINSPSVCGRKERPYRSSAPLTFVRNSWMSILLWQTEVAITGDKLVQEDIMIYNLDMCDAVVECTPAPKTMKDMRKRKLAHHRFEQWCRPGWVTLACMADPFIVCIAVLMIMISNRRNQQEWSRNKDAHPITKQYIDFDMFHYRKVDRTWTRCNTRIVKSVEYRNARNVYTYLHTILFILCHWPVATAAVITMTLLLSGDVELNPGPLTTGDLKKVRNSVWDARAKWYDIGIELEIDVSVLEAIKSDNDDVALCLTTMLTGWLKQTTPSPTWKALADALKSPAVGCGHLAESIESKYCDKGVVPPSGTWQPGNQFPRQASGLYPSQQLHGKYQAMLAPTQGMHGFQQSLQFPQHVHHHSEAASIQPASLVFGQFDSRFGDAVQHQLAYSHHRYGAQHLPPQQLYYANPWQLQPYPTPPSGHIQFTGERQGMHGFQQDPRLPQYLPSQCVPAPSLQAAGQMTEGAHYSHSVSGGSDALNTKTESMDVLSNRPSFQQLSSSEKEELRAMLDDDEEKMKLHFGRVVTKTCDSVEKQTTVAKFAGSILALGAYDPAPEVQDRSLLHEHREEIKGAKAISDIFIILSAYWNYLNYEILKYIVELYGTSEDIERLEDYSKKLHVFCERRIFELPESNSETGNVQNEKQAKFVIKLDVQENITCKEVLQIRRRIAKILRIDVAALTISQMDIGCVQLTFLIPKFLVQEVFPLSSEQISALSKDASVISLECGSYSCENTSKAYTEDVTIESHESLELEELKQKNQPHRQKRLLKARAKHPDDESAERQKSDVADTDATGQSVAGIPSDSELDSTPQAGGSAADATDNSEANSTPLGKYAERLKLCYKSKPKYSENQWPPQGAKKFFNLALIKEETVRKGEISDEFTRLTITGKLDDILRHKKPIQLQDIFNETDDHQKTSILIEGSPGCGKTVLTLHLCLEWVNGKLFKDYKLVILVRLREPAIHKAKTIKEILPRVEMEDVELQDVELQDVAKEIISNRGSGILFIMDGWDELPKDIDKNHTIRQIIAREVISESAVVITSRPTSSATLHRHLRVSSHIEILGFTPSELHEYFTEHLDGNTKAAKADKADKLMLKIRANPTVAGTCTLPLNAAILVHIFDCDGDLPTTEHGIFEALIRNCVLRHLKEREPQHEVEAIKSLNKLTAKVQDQYNELCKVAYEGVMEDRVIFELSKHFNTLGLLQGVECYTSCGTEYFYNFLHLSIQEFLAAQHIATFEPVKQVAEFNKLFGQARFASTFRHYSAITKLATPGIKEIVLRILKRCAAGHPSREDKTHLLSLLNCLHETQETSLYAFVADNLGPKLDLQEITLNPADCLSINFFLRNATEIELSLWRCFIDAEGVKMLFSQDQVYQLRVLNLWDNQIGTAGAEYLGTALKECTKLKYLNLGGNKIGPEGVQHLVTVLEKMVQLKELDLFNNQIGNAGAESLGTALKECTKLEYLDLESNRIGPQGCESLSNGLKQCTKLEHLDLGRNQLGDDAIDVISTSLTKLVHLQKLYLFGNQISDSGCMPLCDALWHCRELQELYLSFNYISESSIHTLCVLMKTAKSLKELYLGGNQFTSEGKAKLRKAREERDPDCVKLNLSVY